MLHTLISISVVFICTTLSTTAQTQRRVSSTDPALTELIESGDARSVTFRALIDRLEGADWLVFVQSGRCPDPVMVGCLIHTVGEFKGHPYLRLIVQREGKHPDQVIATLAHELQHALEVVADGSMSDGASLLALSRRISSERFRTARATIFETAEARRVGDTVLRELLQHRPCAK